MLKGYELKFNWTSYTFVKSPNLTQSFLTPPWVLVTGWKDSPETPCGKPAIHPFQDRWLTDIPNPTKTSWHSTCPAHTDMQN